jgi:hypothetical protein
LYSPQIANDSVLLSFAFVGCNRIDRKDKHDHNTNSSTANIPQLRQTFNEVAQLQPKPDFFFFLGDLVLGLNDDPKVLGGELQAWLNQLQDPHFSKFPQAGIPLVAMPGNHEMLFKADEGELPWRGAIDTWQKVMSGLVPNAKLNRVSGPDSLWQRQTYSFRHLNSHFIVLNTDTWNEDSLIGTFPIDWVEADLMQARADSNVEHIFVLSHKPVVVNPKKEADDTVNDSLGSALWKLLEKYEVEAMLSAHSHQYQRLQPNQGKTQQVIAGNGGSKYNGSLPADEQFMGFCRVLVMKSGRVQLQSYGRCVPKKHYLSSKFATASTLRDTANLAWGESPKAWPGAMIEGCK